MKTLLSGLALLSSLAISAQGPNVCLSQALNSPFAAGQYPRSVAVADFNSDGKPDLVTANQSGNNVSILLGSGTGSFGVATNFGVNSNPYAVVTADFNNDGKADLAVCNQNSNDVSVLLGNGLGGFAAAVNYTVGGNWPSSIASADFNNDGNKDLVTANSNGNNVSVLFGTGNGIFGSSTEYAVGMIPQGVIAGDFNNDGKQDIAAANRMSSSVSLLLGSLSGTFSPAVNFTTTAMFPCSIASSDFNGDGNADLATGNYNGNGNNVSVFLGTGTGSFTPSFTLNSGQYATAIMATDINGDSKSDIVTVNNNDFGILPGIGNGSFGSLITYTVNSGMISIAVNDLNNDNRRDVTLTNFSSNDVTVFVNRSAIISASGPTTFCAGGQVVLRCTKGGNSYLWGPGGSTADSVVVSTSGVYSVTMNAGVCVSASNSMTVTVNPLPTLSIAPATTAICAGQSLTLTVSGANTYSWSNGSLNPSIVVSPTANITYSVTGVNGNGCSGSTTKALTVNALPTLSITTSGTAICTGQSMILTVSGANTYSWSNGSVNPSIVVSPTANITYSVTGVNGNNCSASASKSIQVNPLPTLTVNGGNAVCAGQSLTLNVTGANNYTWSNGSLSASTAVSPSVTVTYTVVGVNGNGCSNSAVKTVTVNALPNVVINGNNSICMGQSLVLAASGANTYTWSNGPVSQSVSVSPTVNAAYTVTGTGANGCLNSAVRNITVNPLPNVNVMSSDSVICAGQSVTLTASGAGTYSWSTGSASATTIQSPTATAVYTVNGTDGNGCSASAIFTQNVIICTGIQSNKTDVSFIQIFPNPNNGNFSIRGERKMEMTLMNELGQVIQVISLNGEDNFSHDVKGLGRGIYFLLAGGGKINKKIVVTQ